MLKHHCIFCGPLKYLILHLLSASVIYWMLETSHIENRPVYYTLMVIFNLVAGAFIHSLRPKPQVLIRIQKITYPPKEKPWSESR